MNYSTQFDNSVIKLIRCYHNVKTVPFSKTIKILEVGFGFSNVLIKILVYEVIHMSNFPYFKNSGKIISILKYVKNIFLGIIFLKNDIIYLFKKI